MNTPQASSAALLELLERAKTVERLLELLRDGDPRIRANSAGAIGNLAAATEHSTTLQRQLSAHRAAPILLNLACFGTDVATQRMAAMSIKSFAVQRRRVREGAASSGGDSIEQEQRFIASLLDCGAVDQLRREGWEGVADVLADEALGYDGLMRVESAEISVLGRSHNSEV